MRIQAAVVHEPAGPFSIEDVDLDDPRPGEVLVRVAAAGLCHTDLVTRDGALPPPLPAVLGHEGAGVVERVGPGVTKVVPGDRVVLTFASCGQCPNCRRGRSTACINFLARNFAGVRPDGSPTLTRDGGPVSGAYFGQSSFATYALATESNVVKVPADVPLELLGPLGCGIQTGAGAVLNSLAAEAGSSIAIFGVGSVGMAALLGALVAGCTTIVAVDPNQERLNIAVELGATHTVDPNKDNAVEAIGEATAGFGADYSLECTGIPAVLRQAVDCLGVPGTCGVLGVAPMGAEVNLDIFSLLAGRTVRGIIEGDSVPDVFIPALINLWRQGRFPFDRLIRSYDFDQINEAAADSEKGIALKAVLLMPLD
ncbi:MAG: NAD(P)-dependent alcohol dehydrogenase [Actinomycetota bacterium]